MIAGRRSTSFRALGTTALVATIRPSALPEARAVLRRELDAIDRACSRFRDDSELSALNRAAGEEVAVGPLLMEALTVALRAASLTGGDVDPTVGRALGALGYDRDFALVGGARPRVRVTIAPVPGWRTVRLDPARGTATVPAGVAVDLGATAKALAADRAVAAIAAETGDGVLVGLGGDIALAGDPPDDGWAVWVTDDHRDPGGLGETVLLRSGGLATSSTTVRRWGAAGDGLHHIVDPRSGAPATEVWRTVSVAAASCVDANIAATAAIVRGRGAVPWLEAAGLPARLVTAAGAVERLGDWPVPVPVPVPVR